MDTHLHHKKGESNDVTDMKQEEDEMEGSQTAGRKRRRQEANPSRSARSNVTETPASVCRRPCVSMVIRAERKEGVALRNTGAGLKEGKAGLTRCFSVRAAVVGPAVLWGRDPKNGPMTAKETMTETEDKVRNITAPDLIHPIMHLYQPVPCVQVLVLVFSDMSTRWFPVLQSGTFYRLVAANTQVNASPDSTAADWL